MKKTYDELLKENKALKNAIEGYRKLLGIGDSPINNRDILSMKEHCKKRGIDLYGILNGNREKSYMIVKKELAIIFKEKGYTLERIANLLNYVNHTSIIYLLKK